jgi:hypothetical protein
MIRHASDTVALASLLVCVLGCSNANGLNGPANAGAAAEVPTSGAGGAQAADARDAGVDAGSDAAAADGGARYAADSGSATAAAEHLQLRGYAQKGPFIRGTSIVVSELDGDLAQTGRSFTAQIADNSGRFSVSVASLAGPYVRLSASGFYFNEVSGELSSAPLALTALSDLQQASSVNVNILTDLETPRVEYLVQHGSSFGEAKQQAQREVLAVFRIVLTSSASSESLDVAGSTEADTALLAASVLVQGYLTVSELSELLSSISEDLREDGTLDGSRSGLLLMNAATLVGASEIRQHIAQRYSELGLDVTIGNFQDHIARFRTDAPYAYVSRTIFPKLGSSGPNVLALAEGSVVTVGAPYSITAKTPPGQPLRIHLVPTIASDQSGRYGVGAKTNLIESNASPASQAMILTVPEPGSLSDGDLVSWFDVQMPMRIEIYEGSSELKTTKTIIYTPPGAM